VKIYGLGPFGEIEKVACSVMFDSVRGIKQDQTKLNVECLVRNEMKCAEGTEGKRRWFQAGMIS